MVSRAIRRADRRSRGATPRSRKNVLKYDDVLNRQREAIYSDRRHMLQGDDIADRVQHFIEDAINAVIDDHTGSGHTESWDFDALWTELKTLYPVSVTIDEVVAEAGNKGRITTEVLKRELLSDARIAYQNRETTLGEAATRELERRVVLQVLDRRWRDHLYEMDYLKDGIGLRAMAQRDPLIEYQREGYQMFQSMMGQIKEESVGYLYNLEVEVRRQGEGETEVEAKGSPRCPSSRVWSTRRPATAARSRCATTAVRCSRRPRTGCGRRRPTPRPPVPPRRSRLPPSRPRRGAFGQRTDGGQGQQGAAPQNRAQRRAADRRK